MAHNPMNTCAICNEEFPDGFEGLSCGHPHEGREDGKGIVRRWVCYHCATSLAAHGKYVAAKCLGEGYPEFDGRTWLDMISEIYRLRDQVKNLDDLCKFSWDKHRQHEERLQKIEQHLCLNSLPLPDRMSR